MAVNPARLRKSSGWQWVRVRKTIQVISLVGFILLLLRIHSAAVPSGITWLPFQLDLLAALTHIIAARTFAGVSAAAILIFLITIFAGRAWCGWVCPLGTILDWIPSPKKSRNPEPVNPSWRLVKYGLLLVILISALFSNLTLLFLDPIAILFRSLSVSVLPALDHLVTTFEKWLYPVSVFQAPLTWFDGVLRPAVLPYVPAQYRYFLVFNLLFFGLLSLNIFAPRFWCRYLCPLGALLGVIGRTAFFRRRASPSCTNCSLCSKTCPTGAIQPGIGQITNHSECIVCMNCLESCRANANVFALSLPAKEQLRFSAERRKILGIFGFTLGGLLIVRTSTGSRSPYPYFLQPPGGAGSDLISKCIRCGECVRACPTSGLQPAVGEAGFEGFMTPVLVPRSGFCDFGCNACGQVCPSEAIPSLSLEEKRTTVVGLAYIDTDRCIAWSDHQDCIVCEEMCPLPEKAVYLETSQAITKDGDRIEISLPRVDRELCIGCGICEYKCPVEGDAAIRVRSLKA